MGHLTDLGTRAREFVTPGLDVGHDQVEAMGRPRWGTCDLGAGLHGAQRPGGRELHDPEAVVEGKVSVELPSEGGVERLGAVSVSHGDDDHL
jgi:hypothetical protein